MLGTLTPPQIEDVLKQHLVGRIGCHADDVTYVVPISYAYDGTYIYCHTFEGMKMTIMRKNPQVCFEVDSTENMADWKSVICWGKFEELNSIEEREQAIEQLMNRSLPMISSQTVHIFPHWPFPPDDLNKVTGILFRIRLDKKTGRFEGDGVGNYYAS